MAPSQSRILSLEQIRETTLAKLGRFPCRWQAHATQVILERKNDLITIAPTGSGKTLTFWMPLLFRADGIQIVVTPLNILGTQNEQELAKFGVRAIAVRAETATPKVFREIREGKYRAIVVSPEELMKVGGGFEDLWNDEGFTSRIMSIVFDEAHCISTWKSFRQDYKNIDRLRYLLPHVPFVLATATLPGEMQREIMKTLQIRADRSFALGYEDLDFLVLPRTERAAGDLIPKFLVFFDNIDDCMSEQFREDDLAAFNASNLYGLCSTDSFGMGVNVADVRIVVQWRMPRDLNTLWQRFGRAARDLTLNAVAILLVDAARVAHQEGHTISPAGRDLRTALDTFRRERTINKYGRALLDNLGASVVLPDDAIDRLVECAQAGKIKSLDDVQREVGKKWGKAREYGEEVAAIIRRIFPLDNPFVVAPLTPRPQPVNAAHVGSSTAPNHSSALATPTPARRTVRQYKCSACGAAGHNKNNRSCPKYASKAQQENAPPTAATAGNADEGPASDTDEQEVQPRRSPLPAPSTVLDTLFTTPSYRRNARVATLEQIRAEQHNLQSPQQQDTVSTPGRRGWSRNLA
ncbi:P-loop containing nucleoside triphosphate hydrolase protein [Fomitopsis serialis]|uniref:P-loop containing nucleoside triphosphate hydrolase protein n=1 Tax=Fomitopsis serialis TaxID=139415 RepID=UPI002007FF0D|nr:P-loop containing nucleoside triphosphate hydrolase protein [Neoantrodia serialis]KAH9938065.1 P-loop containing nucleoside triphosphate hydrolase protein [Neoantrodia serialis]